MNPHKYKVKQKKRNITPKKKKKKKKKKDPIEQRKIELQKKFDSDPKYHGLIAVREDFEPEPEPGYYPDDYSELASNF